jgi:NADPH:quinone reductase-like Zn-dependent oxidoreductase
MKAAIFNAYGEADQLQIATLPKPQVAPGHLLVKVLSVGLNPRDIAIRKGTFKLFTGSAFPKITGADFSGVVEETGAGVLDFIPGDEVFGYFENIKGGVAAEYVSIPARYVAAKPPAVSHTLSSVMPCAYLTALQALRDKAKLKAGQKVLLYGASGGVGTAALQLAKYYQAHVTAVCHSRNRAYCLANGADQVRCYDEENVFESAEDYDVFFQVFSTQGDFYTRAKRILKPGGVFVCLIPNPLFLVRRLLSKVLPVPRFEFLLVKANPKDLQWLAALTARGVLNPQLTLLFPLEQVAEAHKTLERGHVKGKVALQVNPGPYP